MEAVIKDDPECLAMFRDAMKEQAGRPTKESGNNVTELDTGVTGNSRAYSIDRVKRECEPEVVAKHVIFLTCSNLGGTKFVPSSATPPKRSAKLWD